MDEVQSGARAPDQPGPVRQTAGQATEAAGQAARNVTQTAREQTRQVSGEVAAQARGVAADVRDSVTSQAHAQNDRLVESIRRLADELDEMAYDRKDSPARTVVSRVAHSSRQLADHLADRGPEGVLAEVQDFARRRPGTFLMSGAVAGFADCIGHSRNDPSPPFRGEREGPAPKAWEGEVGIGKRSGIPHLTPTLSAPEGGEGEVALF